MKVVGNQGCDAERPVGVEPDGHHTVLTSVILGNQGHGFQIDIDMPQVNHRDAELGAEDGDQGFLGNDAVGDHGV